MLTIVNLIHIWGFQRKRRHMPWYNFQRTVSLYFLNFPSFLTALRWNQPAGNRFIHFYPGYKDGCRISLPKSFYSYPIFLELVEFTIYDVPKRFYYNKIFCSKINLHKHCTLLPTSFEIYSTLSIFNISQDLRNKQVAATTQTQNVRHWSIEHAWCIFQNLAEQFCSKQPEFGEKLREAMKHRCCHFVSTACSHCCH